MNNISQVLRFTLLPAVFYILSLLPSYAQLVLPANLLSGLKSGHPRLLVNSIKDFDDLRQRIDSDDFLAKSNVILRKRADRMLNEPLNKYTLIHSKYLLDVSRSVLDRSYTLAMMYRLSNEKKYADRLWSELKNAADFPDWDPPHFLGTAEMTYAFSIAYDWLYDVWTVEQRSLIKKSILEKGLMPGSQYYDRTIKNTSNQWTDKDNNWNQVCNSSLAVGALAIADEEPKMSEQIIRNALQRLPLAMKHYAPDGAFAEGPMYLIYAMKYNVALIASLESALGSDFGLSKLEGFAKTGQFLMAMSGATGNVFNYSDALPYSVNMPELFWLSRKFNLPDLSKFQQKWSKNDKVVEMLWYKPEGEGTHINTAQYFRKAEVATIRSAWNDDRAWFVGFKGGNNAGSHGHLDIGTFVLEKNGKRWAVDLGPDKYSLPGYFSGNTKDAKRWSYYRTATEGQNTIVVNDSGNANQSLNGSAKINPFVSAAHAAFGVMDLTSAYVDELKSAKRGISLLNKEVVLIQDEINVTTPKELYWVMHTPANISLSADGKTATLTIDQEKIEVVVLSPQTGVFEVLAAAPFLNEPLSTENSVNEGIKRLVIRINATAEHRIAVIFREQGNTKEIKIKPFSAWKN